jgi:GPH family glycoside/pentoside/hexuronide:cation symporter
MQMKRKLGYAAGDMGISISYFAVGFFFMYYLTDFVGINPFFAGLAFFIGKLWDGVNDPLMGIISDRTRSRLGRKRVFVLMGALPLALSFILLWMIPADADEWLQFFMAVFSLTLYATTYTAVVVPYMSLVPVMTNNYDERTQITGFRAIMSSFGTIFGGGAAMLLSAFTDELIGLRTITIAFALFTFISLIIAAQSVKGLEAASDLKHPIMEYGLRRYLAIIKEKNVLVLLCLKFFGAIATGSLSAALPYFANHILGSKGKSTIGLAIYVAVSALAIPLWNLLTKRFDKRRLLLTGNCISALVLFLMAFLLNSGSITYFFIGCFFLGFALSAYLLIPYSLVPDLVDYYEYKNNERHESVFFGLWMTFHQLGISFAGLILGAALAVFGYSGDTAVQTESALFAVRLAFGVVPGVFFITAALIVQKYEVSREVYLKVRTELDRRSGV